MHQHPFLSNVCFASLIRASRLNISLGTKFKPKELGDGPLSSCMNFVGFAPILVIFSLETNPLWGEASKEVYQENNGLAPSYGALLCELFGLN